MEKRIVVGYRCEIGKAIYQIFNATQGLEIKTAPNLAEIAYKAYMASNKEIERTVMHICIPYADNFIQIVSNYANEYKPKIIIVHTTCAIGTTRLLNDNLPNVSIVHASVNCRHPNTEADIRKYDMFVGALNERDGNEACDYIERFGIITYLCDTPESSEFNKIAGTEYCKTIVEFFALLKELVDDDDELNWKESIAYFENLMNKSDGWKRVYRRGNRIDTPISGKHCLKSNNRLWNQYANKKVSMLLQSGGTGKNYKTKCTFCHRWHKK